MMWDNVPGKGNINLYDLEGVTATEVVCYDDTPQETGLLDAYGRKLYKTRAKLKMGFWRCED